MVKRGTRRTVGIRGALVLALLLLLAACGSGSTTGTEDTGTSTAATEPPATTAADSTEATGPDDGDTGGDAAEGDRVFKVGALNPQTGPYTQLGVDVNAGFRHYVEEVKGGQLAGWTIEIIEEDTASDVDQSSTKVRKLVEQDEVDFMFGIVHSGVAYGIAPYINESQVPFIITIAGADGLTQHDASDWIFRINYTGSQDAMPLGDYACNELGYGTAVIVALDYAYGWESAGGFARAYEDAGCDVIQEIYSPLGTEDWVPVMQQIDTNADVVAAFAPGQDATRLVQAYRGIGVQTPLIGIGGLTDEALLPQMGAAGEGIITSLHYSAALDTPENAEFVAAMDNIGTVPGYGSESGWATAMVLEAALEQAGDDARDPEVLRDAIASVELTVPRGPVRFDDYHQAVYNVYIREVQEVDGEWVKAVIETIPDVGQFWTYDPDEYLALPLLTDLVGTWDD